MINRHRLGWLARISFAGLLSLGLVACGDDGDDGMVETDAPPMEIDACADGHACLGSPVALLPEGGTLRVEYVHAGYDGNGDRIEDPMRAFMLQYEGQDSVAPEIGPDIPRPWLGDADPATPNPDPAYASDSMFCYDMGSYSNFFQAFHPNIQALADSRTYYTGGPATITMQPVGGQGITLDRYENVMDPANYITHDSIWMGMGSSGELTRGAKQELEPAAIGPDGDFPGFVAEVGYDVPSGLMPIEAGTALGAYVTPDFILDSPAEQEFFAPGGFLIDPTQDLTMGYTLLDGAEVPADWPTVMWFAGFAFIGDYNNDGMPDFPTAQFLCMGPSGNGNSNPELVIPQALFDDPNFPAQGAMFTGHITHTAWALNETHRFDSVGMNCAYAFYGLVPPAP